MEPFHDSPRRGASCVVINGEHGGLLTVARDPGCHRAPASSTLGDSTGLAHCSAEGEICQRMSRSRWARWTHKTRPTAVADSPRPIVPDGIEVLLCELRFLAHNTLQCASTNGALLGPMPEVCQYMLCSGRARRANKACFASVMSPFLLMLPDGWEIIILRLRFIADDA